nr:polysaccharide lyase 11 [Cytophagales bacterium]
MKNGYMFVLAFLFCIKLSAQDYDLQVVAELDLGVPLGQFRAVPVDFGKDKPKGVAAMYSEDAEIDPYIGMFFFPKNTLKIVVFDESGRQLWKKDLGTGVVPGIWFSPIFAFDLDQNGEDEIWYIDNTDPDHPLDYRKYVLTRLNATTGEIEGQWPWPLPASPQSMSHTYRHFIMGGFVKGEPVLLTAQGTYGAMAIQGWNMDMSLRWEVKLAADAKGAAGSHVTPIVDINVDGVDDLLWGERALELDTGSQMFCADEHSWEGHSDITQPVYDYAGNTWGFFTCRENFNDQAPRVAFYDNTGTRKWGDLEEGHIDTGWAARLGDQGQPVVLGVRVGEKIRTAEGERRTGVEEFTYEAFTGKNIDLGFTVYSSIPVDLNGDGIHELVKGYFEGDGTVLDRKGREIGNIGGLSAMASKFTSLPGEQILSYSKDGKVRIWADKNASDNDTTKKRYLNPFYKTNQKQTGNGYNLFTLGGI